MLRLLETVAVSRELREYLIDAVEEAAEASLLLVEPSGGVLEISSFCKLSDDEPAAHPIYGL